MSRLIFTKDESIVKHRVLKLEILGQTIMDPHLHIESKEEITTHL